MFIPLIFIILILGVEIFDETLFSIITYNYTSYTSIPSNKPGEGSLGGYYSINGQGKEFDFKIVFPEAEEFETHEENGTKICYNETGITGEGHIKSIDIKWDTIYRLILGDFKGAIFKTPLSGYYNVTCAGWSGGGNFSNNGNKFNGTFQITGVKTFFKGNFTFHLEGNKMILHATYIYYPKGEPWKIKKVEKDYYM